MIPDPIHPAIVHFPIVFVVLLPAAALAATVLIARGRPARRTWGWVVGLAVVLSASSWVAVRTGEQQEERVESVVAESVLHEHEEAGERFLALTGATALLLAIGLVPGRAGRLARYTGALATVGLLAAGLQVGHSGGALVYEHGAAQAYVRGGTGASSGDDADGFRKSGEEEYRPPSARRGRAGT